MSDTKPQVLDVICLGGAALDCLARAHRPIDRDTSNPVSRSFSAGGVARNVAAFLARLGARAALVSPVGTDEAGDRLVAELNAANVETAGVARNPDLPTASYTAVLEAGGGMYVGISDMEILERADVAAFIDGLDRLPQAGTWFLDCNLPDQVIGAVLERRPAETRVAVDGTSLAKCVRIKPWLNDVDILIVNGAEAGRLAGEGYSGDDGAAAAAGLVGLGVDTVFVLNGPGGALAMQGGEVFTVPACQAQVCSVTGCGDAAGAGLVWGLLLGLSLRQAAGLGMACAAAALEIPDAVPADLDLADISARAGLGTKLELRA